MILYFADRNLNILGQANSSLPQGIRVTDDVKTEDINTGISIFECDIHFDKNTRKQVEEWTELGNYILRSSGTEQEVYNIVDSELDSKKCTINIYAEDDGLDLINEVVGEYTASEPHPISYYIDLFAKDAGWEIGVNEVEGLTRQLSWTNEQTVSARLLEIADYFNSCEISFSFDIDGLNVAKKYINIYQERGDDTDIQLRVGKEIDKIVTTKSISNLATALKAKGGTPDNADSPVTLLGYKYDDGDFYVDGELLKSRNALEKWRRYFSKGDESVQSGGHIVKYYSNNKAMTQGALCTYAVEELKAVCDMEINYEADMSQLPEDVKLGDRVNIIDEEGEMYISTRILTIETSVSNHTRKAVLGEHLIKNGGISQKVADLAAQFAEASVSAARALEISNNAKNIAEAALTQADAAVTETQNAITRADEAKAAADAVTEIANNAKAEAEAAQAAADAVTESVSSLEATIENAQTAAENAHIAAETATAKADEAKVAAQNAQTDADEAKGKAEAAQTAADSAISKAETAIGTAGEAKTAAESASTIAQAAKLDAEQAEKDIADLGNNLETVKSTMSTDYARKTELTESTANLQSQITRNAGLVSSTVSLLSKIDETANDAQSQAEIAQKRAEEARTQANQATADAEAAQIAADEAQQAANNAQTEANTAREAADTAQAVVDEAEADLEAAITDLETVQSRVDATEEEIAIAEKAVADAQAAVNVAKSEAEVAIKTATDAQIVADTAKENADIALQNANIAASYAKIAQSLANESENALAAQEIADDAADTAAQAQRTANSAVENAAIAQTKADAAASQALAAQQIADAAGRKADQAATDLATAQQNLAEVTSKVDATEEEIEAAKAAVNTAQAAADKAKQDAEAAQTTADTAKSNAQAAQTAANNAKTAADNAQLAANEAQAAADKAQADVNALTTRVSSAETQISQNAQQIALRATKNEVTQTLTGYYTKTETESKITEKAGEINLSVTSKIDNVKVGGRNLLRNSKGSFNSPEDKNASYGYWNLANSTYAHGVELEAGHPYTLSFDWEVDWGDVTPISGVIASVGCGATPGAYTYDIGASTTLKLSNGATSGRVEHTFIPTETDLEGRPYFSMRPIRTTSENSLDGTVWSISNVQLERSSKASDWSPAPEDTEGATAEAIAKADDVSKRLSDAEASIKILEDNIKMLVRNGNKGSQMVQNEDGSTWSFSTEEIDKAISDTSESLDTLKNDFGDTKGVVDTLNETILAFEEHVKITTYEGEPCIILFETDDTDGTNYRQIITNTRRILLNGETVESITDLTTHRSKKVIAEEEVQIGQFVWRKRANGNVGLVWEGVNE